MRFLLTTALFLGAEILPAVEPVMRDKVVKFWQLMPVDLGAYEFTPSDAGLQIMLR